MSASSEVVSEDSIPRVSTLHVLRETFAHTQKETTIHSTQMCTSVCHQEQNAFLGSSMRRRIASARIKMVMGSERTSFGKSRPNTCGYMRF